VQALTSSYGGIEGELLSAVWKLVLAIDVETDLICNSEGTDCRGGCIKRLVACQLRAAGYDAAVCKSKWEGSGRVLQGEHQVPTPPVQLGLFSGAGRCTRTLLWCS
jgi:hypothetical protein